MEEAQQASWQKSFRLDLLRSIPQGVVDTVGLSFAVFLAVRVFDGSALMKSCLVAAPSYGLLTSLFVVPMVKRWKVSANLGVACFWGLAVFGFVVAAVFQSQWGFVSGVSLALFSLTLGIPLSSQLYRSLYPSVNRGRLFGFTGMVRAASAAVGGYVIGLYLEPDPTRYGGLMWLFAGLCMAMILCVIALPSVRLPATEKMNVFGAFRHVKQDRAFRNLLTSWMLLGTGNLMSMALFVEYASNPVHGFAYGSEQVSLLTSVLPMSLFLVTVVGWGVIFDRLNFYFVRALINVFFAIGIGIYYMGGSEWALWVGLGLHGLARGGASVAWSLWVTKFTQKDTVADYMSVHTFLTGCRGVLAPFIAFPLMKSLSPQAVGGISVCLILIATLMISPEIRFGKARRKGKQVERRPLL